MSDVLTTLSTTIAGVTNSQVPSGGAGEEYEFTVGGTWVPGDKITITLTNTLTGIQTQIGAGYVTGVIPSFVITFNNKVYALSGSSYYFSALDDPTTWNNPLGVGNGFVTISNYYASAEQLQAAAPYQGRLAFINRRDVQIWAVDPIPANYAIIQTLLNIGTYAPASVQAVGDMDVYMLYDSGVRSLRVRDASNNAIIADIGTPIDALIQAMPQQPTACAIVDPSANRYLLFIPNSSDPDNGVGKIYAFSYFPSSQIAAWSTYTPSYDSPSAILLTASLASPTQINLVWGGAVSDLGPLTYNLYRSTLSGFFPSAATQIATGLTGTTYADTGLTASTTYYYYAIGIDAIGNEVLSNESNATTPSSGGSAPGPFVLTVTPISNTEIDLSWTMPSGSGITYSIYRSTNGSFTPSLVNQIVASQGGTTYQDTAVGGPNGAWFTTYYYYVIATNGSGSSTSNRGNSNVTSYLPFVGSETGSFVGTATDSSATLSFTNTSGSIVGAGTTIMQFSYGNTYANPRTVVLTPQGSYGTLSFVVQFNTSNGFDIGIVGGNIALNATVIVLATTS